MEIKDNIKLLEKSVDEILKEVRVGNCDTDSIEFAMDDVGCYEIYQIINKLFSSKKAVAYACISHLYQEIHYYESLLEDGKQSDKDAEKYGTERDQVNSDYFASS